MNENSTTRRSHSSASSLGVLAADEINPEVMLTKFSPLPIEPLQVVVAPHDEGRPQMGLHSRPHPTGKRTSTNILVDTNHRQQQLVINEASDNEQAVLQDLAPGEHNLDHVQQEIHDLKLKLEQQIALRKFQEKHNFIEGQQFQVVWRSLSFEVATSSYDKVINTALDGLNALLSFGRSSRSSRRLAGDNLNSVASTCELASPESLPQRKLATALSRTVFKNLNGYIKSGEISAILGPSGAGKTSLLNALCGGKLDHYRGSIQLVGGKTGSKRMQLSIIPQKDYLIENLTVRENLLYSSQLLNTNKDFNHEANIMRVVKMLNLNHCFESAAGNISGGEYKRVSIAQELLRQPDILILDEPTSGLDSLNCKKLIRTLKHLIEASRAGSMKPIAVVMTIHQPDIDIYNMFDHVYCMARGGRVIFDGRPNETMHHLRSFGGFVAGAPNSPPELSANDSQVNPANLLIEIASEDLYGADPVNKLSNFQRKQFEQMFGSSPSSTSSTRTMREIDHYWNQRPPLSQLDASQLEQNIILGQQEDHRQQQCLEIQTNQLDFDTELSSLSSSPSSSGTPSPKMAPRKKSSSRCKDNNMDQMAVDFDFNKSSKSLKRDKRLKSKHDHRGKFWYHTRLLMRRAFVSTLRDPLMTMIALAFHLTLPFVMWAVYPRRVGRIHACPVIQRDLDIVSMASNRTLEKLGEMQGDMTATFECSTMLFVTTYALSMCSLAVAALAFPLSMHILLKEVRNGWYDLRAFVLAKQFASFPFEVIFPAATMVMVYIMLDMPSSELEWRLWSIALVMATIALISSTHGLIIGTLCMDSVQTAVFLSIASTLPQVLLSGFTARLKWMPSLFQYLSWGSQYRYANELMNTIRFGFGICPCDEETDHYLRSHRPNFLDLPENLKSMFVYYLSVNNGTSDETGGATTNGNDSTITLPTNATRTNETIVSFSTDSGKVPGISYDLTLNSSERTNLLAQMETNEVDAFKQLAEMMSRSLSYGREITSCDSVQSELLAVLDIKTEDMVLAVVGAMLGVLLFFKIVLFFVVKYKVGSRI